MKTFWIKISFNHQSGIGYVPIRARDKDEARKKFLYTGYLHKEILKITK